MQKEILEKLLQRQIISHLGWFQKRPHPPSPLFVCVLYIFYISFNDERIFVFMFEQTKLEVTALINLHDNKL